MRILMNAMMTIGVALVVARNGAAEPLKIVEVGAPAINCVFAASCKLSVADSSGPIALKNTTGEGFLQSRTTGGNARGEAGLPGEGLIPHEYPH